MEHRLRGGEILFKECVVCGNDKWNLQVSLVSGKVGLVHCWACEFGGDIEKLKIKSGWRDVYSVYEGLVGDSVQGDKKDVFLPYDLEDVKFCKDDKVLSYLEGRGITREDFKYWSVKVRYPYLHFVLEKDGEMIYWVGKNIETGRYLLPSLPKKDIVWYVDVRGETVLLVEGVFDGIRAIQAGFSVIVLLGKRVYSRVERFIEKFLGSKRLVVALDADAIQETVKILNVFKGRDIYFLRYDKREIDTKVDVADFNPKNLKKRVETAKKWSLSDQVKFRVGR